MKAVLIIIGTICLLSTAQAKEKYSLCVEAITNMYKFGYLCADYETKEEQLVCAAMEANVCEDDLKKPTCKKEKKFFLKCFAKVITVRDAKECMGFPLENLRSCNTQ